mgnify:CR=1 FL=1
MIRDDFGVENLLLRNNMDMEELIAKIKAIAIEMEDEIIVKTILPYCGTITEYEISKDILKRALFEFFANHPEEQQKREDNVLNQ